MEDKIINIYIEEFRAEGIGQNLYDLIKEVVREECTKYPPALYSPNKAWDEDAISGLAHDFIIEKLLRKGWLEYHLYSQETKSGLQQILRRDFRHFLISKKERSELTNLYERVKSVLQNNNQFKPYYPHEKAYVTIWGLGTWDQKGEVVEQHLDKVIEAMFLVELPTLVRYHPESDKISHLVSTDDLERLLLETFKTLQKSVSLSILIEALRYRLGLLTVTGLSIEEPVKGRGESSDLTYEEVIPSSIDANPELHIESKETTDRLFRKFTDRQRTILAYRLSDRHSTYEEIAKKIGISKSTVQIEIKNIEDMIVSEDLNQNETEEIILQLSKICSYYLNRSDGPNDK